MILLENICKKLEKILNGTDTEITVVAPTNENFAFGVFSEGLFLTDLNDMKKGKNIIPVIVGALGGEYNPVPKLEEVDYNVQIQFLFPVRFKNFFYGLNGFLRDIFVGKILTYGEQKALSNISVAQYGELQNISFNEFRRWITDRFRADIVDSNETYMSMTFSLFLNTAKLLGQENGFMMGNNAKIKRVKITNTETNSVVLDESEPVLVSWVNIGATEQATQQLLDTPFGFGYGTATGYTKQLPLIVKNNSEYRELISLIEKEKSQQLLKVEITESLPFEQELEIPTTYFITNYERNNALGEFIGIQLTLSIRGE